MLIVTLSTIPSRFDLIGPTLDSLLKQDLPADAIEVYIPDSYTRFPEWDGVLPVVPKGVTIVRCGEDLGPATKILPATRAYRGQDVDLLFCDDDRMYPPHWTARFMAERAVRGDALAMRGMMVHWKIGGPVVAAPPVASARGDMLKAVERLLVPGREDRLFRRSGHVDMFEGCGGVMVRPEMFEDADFDIPTVARPVDDVWLSGMLARKGIAIWLMANERSPKRSAAHNATPLDDVERHGQNIAAIRHIQDSFEVWRA